MRNVFVISKSGFRIESALRSTAQKQNSYEAKIMNHTRHACLPDRQAGHLRMSWLILLYVLMPCMVKITRRLA